MSKFVLHNVIDVDGRVNEVVHSVAQAIIASSTASASAAVKPPTLLDTDASDAASGAATGSAATAEAQRLYEKWYPALSVGDYTTFCATAAGSASAIFATLSDEEIETIYFIFLSFVPLIPADKAAAVMEQMAATVAASTERSMLRLKLLANFFNSESNKHTKLNLFFKIVQYAGESKHMDLLAPYLTQASQWPTTWGISSAEARKLYLLISQTLSKTADAENAQTFLIRYLTTFENEGPELLEESKEVALEAALGFVKAPAISQRSSLPHLAAIRALKNDTRYANLYELVTIFASGDIKDYVTFYEKNKAYVDHIGVNHVESLETMRLLTLCSMAAAKSQRTLAELAEGLQCAASEVESWVVMAVARGLIRARIDQALGIVSFSWWVQREFSMDQWVVLQKRLAQLREGVNSMLSTLETGKAPSS